jgi:hypothetical protein
VLPYNRPLPFIVIMGYGVFAALVMFWQSPVAMPMTRR